MATQIVFLGSTKGQPLMVTVDQDAKHVGQTVSNAGELSQFTRDQDPIWVNLSNVLYVEGEPESGSMMSAE
jgi:hypothetical protein